jgi:hypothetical protein
VGDDEVVEEIWYSWKSLAIFVGVRHDSQTTVGTGVLENRVLTKGDRVSYIIPRAMVRRVDPENTIPRKEVEEPNWGKVRISENGMRNEQR